MSAAPVTIVPAATAKVVPHQAPIASTDVKLNYL
jgi:hypothetical protein